jgi:hypothetical protein
MDYLSLIPEEPSHVPPADAQLRALDAFRSFVKKAREIKIEVSDEIQFIYQGKLFSSVYCPACNTEAKNKSWVEWMDKSYVSKFTDRSITMPCCGCETELNALRYVEPTGFARFVLRAVDPEMKGCLLPADKLSVLEGILGCKLRQVVTVT